MTLAHLLAAITHRALLRALRLAHGARAPAAHTLGVSPRQFQRLLAAHVPPSELAALAHRHGWPTRREIAAHARSARATPAWEPSAPLKVGDAVQLPDGARRRVTIPKNTPRSSPYEDPRMALPARGR